MLGTKSNGRTFVIFFYLNYGPFKIRVLIVALFLDGMNRLWRLAISIVTIGLR